MVEEIAAPEDADTAPHIPVMLQEVLETLDVKVGMTVVDVTAGAGGHLRALCEAVGPTGRVIALDRDARAHQDDAAGGVVKSFADRAELVRAPFSELATTLAARNIDGVDALLADLGVSSMQLDETVRGFSFQRSGPLDMRMDTERLQSAWDFLATHDENEIADVLFHYGDERKSRRIAHAIKRAWPIEDSTLALAEIVSRSLGGRRGRIHPATRTFQALRIAVNRELDELDALLNMIPSVLALPGEGDDGRGGRCAIISFHSLEDRRVKRRFQSIGRRSEAGDPTCHLLTKRPLVATDVENRGNPRARSAKLRVLERIR